MRKVLVVDDEWAIAEVLVDLLGDEGYEVLSASNGREALDVLAESPNIALVLLDYMMPVMDGAATLAAIRAHPGTTALPVIMMTSLPERSLAMDPRLYRAYLRKPFLIDDVLDAVSRALEARPSGQDDA